MEEQNTTQLTQKDEPSPAYRDPEFPPKENKKKRLILILVIALLLIGLIALISSCSHHKSENEGSASSYSSYVDPYVTIVKNAENSNYGITYGRAFDSFFRDPKWDSFTASSGENVVEFTGTCSFNNAPATVQVQFVVDLKEGTLEVYYMSINDVSLNRLEMASVVQKVFESY